MERGSESAEKQTKVESEKLSQVGWLEVGVISLHTKI